MASEKVYKAAPLKYNKPPTLSYRNIKYEIDIICHYILLINLKH